MCINIETNTYDKITVFALSISDYCLIKGFSSKVLLVLARKEK